MDHLGLDPGRLASWRSLLCDIETLGSSNIGLDNLGKGMVNLLVTNASSQSNGLISADMMVPLGTSTMSAMTSRIQWDEQRKLDDIMLLWDVRDHHYPDMWLLKAYSPFPCDSQWDFAVTDQTTLVPVTKNDSPKIHILELFAGAYGGWSSTIQHLQDFHDLDAQTISVEFDLKTCLFHAASRSTPIINGFTKLPTNLFQGFHNDLMIHADATSLDWIAPIGAWHPDIVCLSPPCPPWSRAGRGAGLGSIEGMLFPESVSLLRWLQPSLILVENVAGFQSHEHKPFVLRTISMLGYRLAWARVLDLKAHAPCSRPRWLALFERCSDPMIDQIPFQMWPNGGTHTPETFDSILPPPWALDQALRIDDETMQILANPLFAPWKTNRILSREQVLETRRYQKCDTLPAFLASYGRQHRFSEHELKSRGCLAHFFRDQDLDRWWHPLEVLLHHCALRSAILPKNVEESWKYLGNQISTLHAAVLLTNALRKFKPAKFSASVQEVFLTIADQRLRASTCQIQETSEFYCISRTGQRQMSGQEIDQLLHFLATCGNAFLPENQWWDFAGFHDMIVFTDLCHVHVGSPISISTNHEDEISYFPETLQFQPVINASFHCADVERTLAVSAALSNADIVQLWGGRCQVEHDSPFGIQLLPIVGAHAYNNAEKVIVCCQDGSITVYLLDQTESLRKQIDATTDAQFRFDVFGEITTGQRFHQLNIAFPHELKHGSVSVDIMFALAALSLCNVLFQYDQFHDIWAILIQGDSSTLQAKTFVQEILKAVFTEDVLHTLGRELHTDTDHRILFRPCSAKCPAPPEVMKTVFAVLFARILLDNFAVSHGQETILKWRGRPLWKGRIDTSVSAEVLAKALQYALSACTDFSAIRIVHRSKQFASGFVSELEPSPGNPLLLHLSEEIWGGGGPSSTKGQVKQKIRNSIAGSLLSQGFELGWVHSNVEKILDQVPQRTLMPIVALPDGQQKETKFKQMLLDCNIDLPKIETRSTKAQSLMPKHKKRQTMYLNPAEYQLDCSCFLNEDGSHPNQITDFRGGMTGVCLVDADMAKPWLHSNKQLSSDELGMLILGPLPVKCDLDHQEVVVPGWDRMQQHVLLSATLVQFGAKKLAPKQWEKTIFTANISKVVAFTLWRQDWTKEEWGAALSQTNQFIREIFASQGVHAIVAFWGRSLRSGRSQATPDNATSMQIHASIESENYLKLLTLTGFNKVWAAPKLESGRLSDEFRILWLPATVDDLQKAAAMSATMSGNCGLVRGKSNFGIRLSKASFESAWKHLHPSEPCPPDIPSTFVYKLEPLPFGSNPQVLLEWGKHVKWVFRPMKPTGPRAWLVCTGEAPPSTQLAFNGQVVLATLLPPRQSAKTSMIVAGPRLPAADKRVTEKNSNTNTDPWATYRAMNPFSAHSSQPTAVATPGPTEARFQQQEEKLTDFEQKLNEIQSIQQQQAHTMSAITTEVQTTEKRLQASVTQAIDGVKAELSNSFAAALGAQTKQFDHGMNEIKALLHASMKRKTTEPGDAEMRS